MGRFILLIFIVLAGYALVRSWRNRAPLGREHRRNDVETMKRCAHCGVHVPESEAVQRLGRYYCSDACRRQHAGDH